MRPARTEGRQDFLSLPADWRLSSESALLHAAAAKTIALTELREARFSAGLRCARCGSPRVHRWGQFCGRRRYRCLACKRTFSDLTGTAMAYSKLPGLWGAFAECMAESLTVRAAAARLGINKDTAWRWRHRVLEAQLKITLPPLRGIVETHEARLFSSRRRCGWSWFSATETDCRPRSVWLLVARDRSGNTRVAVSGARRPTSEEFRQLMGGRPVKDRIVLDPYGDCGAGARYAAATGNRSARAARLAGADGEVPRYHLRNVIAYQLRLRRWLQRFRGVAVKYLPRYLRWHRLLDEQRAWPRRMIIDPLRRPAPRRPP